MNWLINLMGKFVGASGWLGEYMPLLGGLSAVLIGAGHIAQSLSGASDPASVLAVVKGIGSSPDAASIASGVALIVQHFKHQAVAAQADASTQMTAAALQLAASQQIDAAKSVGQ